VAPLKTVLLENEHLRVCIVNLGLRTHSLEFRAASSWVPVIRSLNSIAAHREDDAAFGALVGRAAGRTHDGLAMIAGTSIQLDQNHGRHHLHGGQQGMTQATWALKQTGHSLSATLVSKDGEMGYPGELQLHCMIRLDGPNIHYELEATSSETTYFNPTWHHYFCLGNAGAFQDQVLTINATHAYANDANGIAIDERFMPAPLLHRAATIADWMAAPHPQILQFAGLDHYFVGGEDTVLAVLEALPVRSPSGNETHHDEAASRSNPNSTAAIEGFDNAEQRPNVRATENHQASIHTGIRMTLKSSAPGLQVYTGQKLGASGPGLALEPMVVPNALAFGEWHSSVVLDAGQLFSRSMTLAFSTFK
jgi:galactose mutarotase-like enzyme